MNKNRKTGIAAALTALVLLIIGIVPYAMAEEPGMTVEAPTVSEPTAGDYSGDADGGYEEYEEVTYPGAEEPTDVPAAVTTAVPLPTEIPEETGDLYSVSFTTPSVWTNAAKGTVTVQINDLTASGVQRVEYCLNSSWQDITTDYFLTGNGDIAITVRENGTLTLRITDPHGRTFEESVEITVFDRNAPTLQARIEGENLRVQTSDDGSGIAGVQVNGLLFTTVDNGVLNVRIPDVLSKYDHLAVRAFDYAGNFSDPISLDNPFYQAETATPSSQNTPGPGTSATATPEPAATQVPYYPTSEPYYNPPASSTPQVIYVTAEPPAATPTPIIQTEYVPIGPGMPYLADGNGHTLDVLYSAATNKQFITMQTKSGNTFYLVIDYDKPIDEDAEMYETYFLNLVDERDLLSLMSEEEQPSPTPQIVYVTPEPTAVPQATATPAPTPVTTEDPNAKQEKNPVTGIIALVVIVAAGGGIAFWFVKSKGKNSKQNSASGFDFDDDDEEDEEEEDSKEDSDKES